MGPRSAAAAASSRRRLPSKLHQAARPPEQRLTLSGPSSDVSRGRVLRDVRGPVHGGFQPVRRHRGGGFCRGDRGGGGRRLRPRAAALALASRRSSSAIVDAASPPPRAPPRVLDGDQALLHPHLPVILASGQAGSKTRLSCACRRSVFERRRRRRRRRGLLRLGPGLAFRSRRGRRRGRRGRGQHSGRTAGGSAGASTYLLCLRHCLGVSAGASRGRVGRTREARRPGAGGCDAASFPGYLVARLQLASSSRTSSSRSRSRYLLLRDVARVQEPAGRAGVDQRSQEAARNGVMSPAANPSPAAPLRALVLVRLEVLSQVPRARAASASRASRRARRGAGRPRPSPTAARARGIACRRGRARPGPRAPRPGATLQAAGRDAAAGLRGRPRRERRARGRGSDRASRAATKVGAAGPSLRASRSSSAAFRLRSHSRIGLVPHRRGG